MWQLGWKWYLGENGYMYGIHVYVWPSSPLFTWNYHKSVNWLYLPPIPNKKYKVVGGGDFCLGRCHIPLHICTHNVRKKYTPSCKGTRKQPLLSFRYYFIPEKRARIGGQLSLLCGCISTIFYNIDLACRKWNRLVDVPFNLINLWNCEVRYQKKGCDYL